MTANKDSIQRDAECLPVPGSLRELGTPSGVWGKWGAWGDPGGGSYGFGSANATLEGSCFLFRSSQAARLSIFFEKFVVSTEATPQDSL